MISLLTSQNGYLWCRCSSVFVYILVIAWTRPRFLFCCSWAAYIWSLSGAHFCAFVSVLISNDMLARTWPVICTFRVCPGSLSFFFSNSSTSCWTWPNNRWIRIILTRPWHNFLRFACFHARCTSWFDSTADATLIFIIVLPGARPMLGTRGASYLRSLRTPKSKSTLWFL